MIYFQIFVQSYKSEHKSCSDTPVLHDQSFSTPALIREKKKAEWANAQCLINSLILFILTNYCHYKLNVLQLSRCVTVSLSLSLSQTICLLISHWGHYRPVLYHKMYYIYSIKETIIHISHSDISVGLVMFATFKFASFLRMS